MTLDPDTTQAIYDIRAQLQFMIYVLEVGVAAVFGSFVHRLVIGAGR